MAAKSKNAAAKSVNADHLAALTGKLWLGSGEEVVVSLEKRSLVFSRYVTFLLTVATLGLWACIRSKKRTYLILTNQRIIVHKTHIHGKKSVYVKGNKMDQTLPKVIMESQDSYDVSTIASGSHTYSRNSLHLIDLLTCICLRNVIRCQCKRGPQHSVTLTFLAPVGSAKTDAYSRLQNFVYPVRRERISMRVKTTSADGVESLLDLRTFWSAIANSYPLTPDFSPVVMKNAFTLETDSELAMNGAASEGIRFSTSSKAVDGEPVRIFMHYLALGSNEDVIDAIRLKERFTIFTLIRRLLAVLSVGILFVFYRCCCASTRNVVAIRTNSRLWKVTSSDIRTKSHALRQMLPAQYWQKSTFYFLSGFQEGSLSSRKCSLCYPCGPQLAIDLIALPNIKIPTLKLHKKTTPSEGERFFTSIISTGDNDPVLLGTYSNKTLSSDDESSQRFSLLPSEQLLGQFPLHHLAVPFDACWPGFCTSLLTGCCCPSKHRANLYITSHRLLLVDEKVRRCGGGPIREVYNSQFLDQSYHVGLRLKGAVCCNGCGMAPARYSLVVSMPSGRVSYLLARDAVTADLTSKSGKSLLAAMVRDIACKDDQDEGESEGSGSPPPDNSAILGGSAKSKSRPVSTDRQSARVDSDDTPTVDVNDVQVMEEESQQEAAGNDDGENAGENFAEEEEEEDTADYPEETAEAEA
jgi:hypothetical protein